LYTARVSSPDAVVDPVAPAPPREETPRPHTAESVMRTCPNCGAELAERKCKLYCPRAGCGFYLSCADFY
jgi:hypothetical protein